MSPCVHRLAEAQRRTFQLQVRQDPHYAPLKLSFIIVRVLDYNFGFPSTARHNSKQHISGFFSKAYSWAFDLRWVNGWLGNNCKLVFDK